MLMVFQINRNNMDTIEYVTKRLHIIWLDNIGSGDSLVPAGIKPLPGKMLNNAMTPNVWLGHLELRQLQQQIKWCR